MHPLRRPLPLVLACFALIAALALVVRGRNMVTRFDADVVRRIGDARPEWLVDVARVVTDFGNALWLGLFLIAAGIVLALVGRLRRVLAAAPVASLALGAAAAPLLKAVVERPRPPLDLHEVVESSSGFPSGHSTQSAAGWLALGLVLALTPGAGAHRAEDDHEVDGHEVGDHPVGTAAGNGDAVGGPASAAADGAASRPAWRWLGAGILVAVLVGLSRVVLGVHSPTDVVGGWALGTVCAVLVVGLALRAARSDAAGPRT